MMQTMGRHDSPAAMRDATPLQVQLDAAWAQLTGMEDAIESLKTKLLPITNTLPRPTPGDNIAAAPRQGGYSDVTERVNTMAQRIDELARKIRSIGESLDI